RDLAFLLAGASGAGAAVLKISNPAEDAAVLDMEALAAWHVARFDPGLAVAQPRPRARPQACLPTVADDPSACRVRWQSAGTGYWVRAYDALPGRARLDPLTLPDEALVAWGETTARLGVALRGFIHPRAIRRLPWDVHHAASARPMTGSI